nr:PKD domain-containing protein [Aeromicrobium sp. CFBP 8757]
MRNDGDDTNASDYFFSAGRLDLTVHTTGTLLSPTVVSSGGTELDLDAPTTFSVSLPESTADVLTTRWDFGDGSTKGTKRDQPTKTYAKRGTYPVSVAVRTSDGSYGRSAPLEVKIANPPKAPSSGTGGGSDLGGGGGYTGGGGLPAPFDPFEGDVDQPAPSDELPDVEEDPAPTAPVDDGLEPVEGYVLAGAETVPGGTPETIPGTQASTAPAPATQASTRQRIATWAVAAAAVLLLVGLGAASETRWLRHRLRHLRRAA